MIDATTLIANMSGSILIAGAAGGFARWYVKRHSTDSIKEYLKENKEYLQELKPNGGGSLNDAIKLHILPAVNEVKEDIKELKIEVKELREDNLRLSKDVARLEGRVQAHIEAPREPVR